MSTVEKTRVSDAAIKSKKLPLLFEEMSTEKSNPNSDRRLRNSIVFE